MNVTYYTDMEWQRLLQVHALEDHYFSERKSSVSDCYIEDAVNHRSSDCPISDSGLSYEQVDKYEKYVREAVNILGRQKGPPKPKQLIFLLDLTTQIVKDETCFIKLNTEKVLQQLILISKPTLLDTGADVKLLFVNLLNASLCHKSGVKWTTGTNYWLDVYSLILQFHVVNNIKILEAGYSFLTTLLERAIEEDREFCIKFLQFLAGPILLTVQQLKVSKSTSIVSYKQQIYNDISSHGICLVEILERLLKSRNTQILNFFLKLRVREASDNIALISDNDDFSIIMYRVVILLSFYEISELFDGIGIIQESTMALSGIHRIIGRETEKCNISVILEACRYAIAYSKIEGIKLPKFQLKNHITDIECELVCFQILPASVVLEFLSNTYSCNWDDLADLKSCVIYSVGMEMTKECSLEGFKYGYALKEKINNCTLDLFIESFDILLKTKPHYSMQNINRIVILLSLILEEAFNYFKDIVKKRIISYEEQMLIERTLEILVDFMETPNMHLDNHLKLLDMPTVMHNLLYYISWSSPVVIKGLRFLKLLISKHISPEMLLLIDSVKDTGMGDIGHMLFVKLFSSDWEIRHVALGVVTIIARTANESFPSFRETLIEASLPEVVATLCTEDRNPLVRAAAFKCLQDIFVVKDIGEKLKTNELTDKVLEAIPRETDSLAKKEAIKLITVMYWHNKDTEEYSYITKIHTTLEMVAFSDKNHLVQQEVLKFWRMVVSKYMMSIGWVDKSFPPIIFSKKIVRMTNEEIGRRIFRVLDDLNNIGCLNIIKHFLECSELSEEVSTILEDWLHELYNIYCRYKVTKNSLRPLEDDSTVSSITTCLSASTDITTCLSPSADESAFETDEIMRIVDQLFPAVQETEEYAELISIGSSLDIPQQSASMKISPAEFVGLIYDKVKIKKETQIQHGKDYIIEY